VFLVSAVLLGLYFLHVVPFQTVFLTVLIKIVLMIGAIVTGALWEHDVYGQWWFASDFFIEDVMTLNVFLLHAGFLIAAYGFPQNFPATLAMLLVAYTVYGINVVQYVARNHGNRKHDAEMADVAEVAA
jgi:3-vinyl bacteriochlorophyllide hydratase